MASVPAFFLSNNIKTVYIAHVHCSISGYEKREAHITWSMVITYSMITYLKRRHPFLKLSCAGEEHKVLRAQVRIVQVESVCPLCRA